MVSLRLFISVGTIDSKRSNLFVNPIQFPDRCSISSCVRVIRPHLVTGVGEFSNIKVSATESNEDTNNIDLLSTKRNLVSETLVEEKLYSSMKVRRGNRVGKRGTATDKSIEFTSKRNRDLRERETHDFFLYDGELDVNYSAIGPDLGLEQCEVILKRLEKYSGSKTLRFFEWMRSNSKLEKNVSAYSLVLRVLGRKEDWDATEKLVRESSADLGCKLSFRVFNTVIYACCKRGRVDLVTKWFRLMLELEARPNVATFGMVMGLYQKGWKIVEAEFAFGHMRSFGIICQSAYSAMITIYTRLYLYDKAEEVIRLMREDKVVMNMENWLVLLNAYSQQGKLHEAEQVLISMQEAGFSSNIVAYNTLITGYGKVSNMDAAQCIFSSIKRIGLEPDETTYRSMIEGWGRAGNYRAAEWYYKELKKLSYKPNSSNLYTLINLQAKHGDKNGAIRILDDMLKIGCQYSSIVGTLLQAYARAGKFDMVPLLLRGALYQHILVNQTSCFTVVTAYVKNGLVDDAIMVLRDKKWEDQNFEDNLYHLLICTCKDSGNLENAVKIYTQMPKSDDKPNLHISCTMIDVYSIMGLFTEAEKVYMYLKSSGIALDMIAFSVVVRMYVKSGSLSDACAVLETMVMQTDIIPDIHLFRDMFRVYQRCDLQDKLADLYNKILKSGITWDQEMYNCVINCCSRALPVNELSRLFDEMIWHGFAPNTITFNVMLDVFGKSKLFNKARELFWMAKKRGLINVISYNTIFAAYGQNKDFKNMSSIIRHMQFDGFSVSLEVYNCMLDAYGKEGQMENFRTVLHRMKESSCAADHYTYNIMINIYGERGWIDQVADVLTELSASGLKPNLCSYNTLIKAYGIAGMVEDAVSLVKEMRDNGIEPDKVTYTNLITALQKNDEFFEAVRWSLWMKQMGL